MVVDGAGENIWDVFAAQERILDGYNAQRTCAHLEHYKEDYALMKQLGKSLSFQHQLGQASA